VKLTSSSDGRKELPRNTKRCQRTGLDGEGLSEKKGSRRTTQRAMGASANSCFDIFMVWGELANGN